MKPDLDIKEQSLAQRQSYAKYLWEVEALTAREISEIVGASEKAIGQWAITYKWLSKREIRAIERGEILPETRGSNLAVQSRELTRQNFLNIMAKKGMPPEKVLDLLIDGLKNPKTKPFEITRKDPETGKMVKKLVRDKDYKTRHKYLQEYLNISGLSSPSVSSGDTQVNVQINLPSKPRNDS